MSRETIFLTTEYEKKLSVKDKQIDSLIQTIRDILDPKNQALIDILLSKQVKGKKQLHDIKWVRQEEESEN